MYVMAVFNVYIFTTASSNLIFFYREARDGAH